MVHDRTYFFCQSQPCLLKHKPPIGHIALLEASSWHLPEIPSHKILQKVKGYVDGFTKLRGNNNQLKNTLFCPEVKGKIAFGNSLNFSSLNWGFADEKWHS